MVKLYNQIDVNTTVTRIIPSNPRRTSLVIRNIGDYNIYLGTDNQVTTTNGFKIAPGNIVSFSKDFGDNPELEFYAIAESGASRIAYLEQVKKE